jgi:hypothetical protein
MSTAVWTAQEDAILRDVYPGGGLRASCAVLPHRSRKAIGHRAWALERRGQMPRGRRGRPRNGVYEPDYGLVRCKDCGALLWPREIAGHRCEKVTLASLALARKVVE